jgi:two-component system sensor kinase FixL
MFRKGYRDITAMENLGLFDALPDSAVLLDKAGRIINWNAGASTLFGYSKKEVLGRSINFVYDRNYPFPKLIQELGSHQKKWQEDTTFIRKNGIKGYCKSSLCGIPLSDHSKAVAILIHHNLSEYKKTEDDFRHKNQILLQQLQHLYAGYRSASNLLIDAVNNQEQIERKLRESELSFHLLAENATDVISRHAPDGAYLYVSPASKTSIGFSPEELINKNIYKLVHHDDLAKLKKAFTRKRENIGNKLLAYRIKRKDGEFRWFESNIRLILDEQGRMINEIQLASRDITDRVLDKKARLRGQQLAHVFRLSTMEEMASGMAHEISQPLAAIVNYTRGCVRHLQNNSHDQDQLKEIMTKAVAQAERAGEIMHRLKNFFCKGQLVKTPCKVNHVIKETISLMKNELTTSQTKIDFDFERNIPPISIDKIQIQQVILNLIQNAIEAMQETHTKEKRIHIQIKGTHFDSLEVTLMDTGPGFSKENITKVFMPFFTTKAHGRGMGLAICRSIIEAHGGQFTINSNTSSSSNSWIRFSLPVSI